MKVFLSGKVDPKHGAWRDALLSSRQSWVYEADRRIDWDNPVLPWPTLQNIVLGLHDYVGPYRQVWPENHSSYWGALHGVETVGNHGQVPDDAIAVIAERCRSAIRAADLVFAYINTPDAFGSLAEIGYAAALGKFTVALVHPDAWWDYNDYSFVQALASFAPEYEGSYSDAGEWVLAPEHDMVRKAFEQGLVHYTAHTPRPERSPAAGIDVVHSFSQIATWTSDPRVRNEALRMLSLLAREVRR